MFGRLDAPITFIPVWTRFMIFPSKKFLRLLERQSEMQLSSSSFKESESLILMLISGLPTILALTDSCLSSVYFKFVIELECLKINKYQTSFFLIKSRWSKVWGYCLSGFKTTLLACLVILSIDIDLLTYRLSLL